MSVKVTEEQARFEAERWLERRHVSPSKLKGLEEAINDLIDYLRLGTVIISEEGVVTQFLMSPIEDGNGNSILSQLTFKTRISVNELKEAQKGIDAKTDPAGFALACASALTGQSKAMIGKQESYDFQVTQTITVFFL